MDWFFDLITNPVLITGVSSWFLAQVLKTILYALMNKKLDWSRMVGDGGMPSGHSATVTSVATVTGLLCGFGSVEFAISAIIAIVVCHDAMGVRQETGKQAVLLNEITKIIEILSANDLPEVKLKEFVGHTPLQVYAGVIIGILNAMFMYFIVF